MANKLVIQVLSRAKQQVINMLYKYVLVRQPKYLVIVEWWFPERVVQHKADSFREAIEWMQCYPNDCCILIRDTKKRKGSKFGNIVASRGY